MTFTLFAISHAVHQVAVRLDPQEVKCGIKNEFDPAIPCGNVLSFALRLFSGKVQYLTISYISRVCTYRPLNPFIYHLPEAKIRWFFVQLFLFILVVHILKTFQKVIFVIFVLDKSFFCDVSKSRVCVNFRVCMEYNQRSLQTLGYNISL